MAKRIHDVDVNRAALKKAGSLEEFKKLNPEIFSHLADQDGAYAELYAEFTPAMAVKLVASAATTAAQ